MRGNNRASHVPRVREYRRGYAIATLHADSSDPRGLPMPADFAPSEQTTSAVRLRSTGAPHRSKGVFHTYRWRFSRGAVGRVDVGHVQLVIRLSRCPLLREPPWRGCSVPASRIAFRNACERVICRPHAHSRAPAALRRRLQGVVAGRAPLLQSGGAHGRELLARALRLGLRLLPESSLDRELAGAASAARRPIAFVVVVVVVTVVVVTVVSERT